MTVSTRWRGVSLLAPALVLSFASVFTFPSAGHGAEAKKLSGYELEQTTSFNGKYRVTACPTAVRLDHLVYGWSLVSCAPKWDVQVFRQDTKQYSLVPYKDWLRANTILITTVWTMELKKPTSSKHFEKDGMPYISYIFPSTSSDRTFMSSAGGTEEAKAMENNRGEIVCFDYPSDIHVGGIVGRACELPELQGIAVQVNRRSARASAWTLRTIKTRRVENISSQLFDLPKGLKKVPFERSMFSSPSAKDSINFMLGDPDK